MEAVTFIEPNGLKLGRLCSEIVQMDIWQELSTSLKIQFGEDMLFPENPTTMEKFGGPLAYLSFRLGRHSMINSIEQTAKEYLMKIEQEKEKNNEPNGTYK